jgi:hypothetical protein
VLYDVLLLSRVWQGTPCALLLLPRLALHLLLLLGRRHADGPPELAEDVGFNSCRVSDQMRSPSELDYPPSTQYGHRIWALFTLPHAEHRFSDVISFSPLPAMNRWRFLRYDVFFFGTALSIPSQMSPNDGSDGSDSEGMARAAKGVGSVRKGCERRCSSGRFRTGRTAPLGARPGSSVCQSGGSGRARAIVGVMVMDVPSSRCCGRRNFWREKHPPRPSSCRARAC